MAQRILRRPSLHAIVSMMRWLIYHDNLRRRLLLQAIVALIDIVIEADN